MTGNPRRTPRSGVRRARQRRIGTDRTAAVVGRGTRANADRLRIAAIAACVIALVVPLAMVSRFFGDDPTSAEPVTGPATEPAPTTTPSPERPETTQPAEAAEAKLVIPENGPDEWQVAKYTAEPSRQDGRTVRVQVRVEKTLPVDAQEAAEEAAKILTDDRSWQKSENVRFQFVGTGDADLTINIATPGTTDKLCLPARTGGELSCRNGNRVALNAKRWLTGVEAYGDDLQNYRRYLVNHEVGHYLGHGHVDCPGAGEPAPLMMQQTKGVGECEPNPWPN